MDPRRKSELKVKVATRSQSLQGELVVLLGLVALLIGVSFGL